MKLRLSRQQLLRPLQIVAGVVDKRHTMPILSHILVSVQNERMFLTATDLEIELIAETEIMECQQPQEFTFPAKKVFDICRSLGENAEIELNLDGNKLTLKSGRSRFSLSTFTTEEFPRLSSIKPQYEFELPSSELRILLDRSAFAMAQQDVRYYLNGLLFDIAEKHFQVVATDGHRLALSKAAESLQIPQATHIIVPRKGVAELLRLLGPEQDSGVKVGISINHLRVITPEFTFTTKLIDGKFPDYNKVIPKNHPHHAIIEKNLLKQTLQRVSVLSNEKYHSIRMYIQNGLMRLVANNPEQEEAEDEIEIHYNGPSVEIGFNVSYLLDVLNVLPEGSLKMAFANESTSVLLQHTDDTSSIYVIMPMRL